MLLISWIYLMTHNYFWNLNLAGCLPDCLTSCLSVCLSVCLSACLPAWLSDLPPVRLPACVTVCVFAFPPSLHIHLPASLLAGYFNYHEKNVLCLTCVCVGGGGGEGHWIKTQRPGNLMKIKVDFYINYLIFVFRWNDNWCWLYRELCRQTWRKVPVMSWLWRLCDL